MQFSIENEAQTKTQKPQMIKIQRKRYGETLSIHGLHRIIGDNYSRLEKLVWLLCVFFGILGAVIITRQLWIDYFEFKVNTSIKVIYPDHIKMPSITICDLEKEIGVENDAMVMKSHPPHVMNISFGCVLGIGRCSLKTV